MVEEINFELVVAVNFRFKRGDALIIEFVVHLSQIILELVSDIRGQSGVGVFVANVIDCLAVEPVNNLFEPLGLPIHLSAELPSLKAFSTRDATAAVGLEYFLVRQNGC